MTKMAWVKRVRIIDADKAEDSMRKILKDWSDTDNNAVAYAFTEFAQEIGIQPETVLTDKQVKELRKRGVL
jgi:hypothetical protein